MNNRYWRLFRLALALAGTPAVMAVGACTSTQSPERQVEDGTIHTKILGALTEARLSNVANIDINVTNGVVTLAGEVKDDGVRGQAERLAHNVEGVRSVINNLQVEQHAAR